MGLYKPPDAEYNFTSEGKGAQSFHNSFDVTLLTYKAYPRRRQKK